MRKLEWEEQIIICHAAAYPDPLTCRTLEDARRKVATLKPAEGHQRPVIYARRVTEWEKVT